MRGTDFLLALLKAHVEIPIRLYIDGQKVINIYRPEGLCFCDLSLEEGDDETDDHTYRLLGSLDINLIANARTDRVRSIAKAICVNQPRSLMVVTGNDLAHWTPHRGWK